MHRIALILLLVLLPLQSIWAAAARVCPHEPMSSARHGAAASPAHSHAHANAHEHSGSAANDSPADLDGDPQGSGVGASCHGQAGAAVIADMRPAIAGSRAAIVPCPYARFIAERFLESPLRPPVLPLA